MYVCIYKYMNTLDVRYSRLEEFEMHWCFFFLHIKMISFYLPKNYAKK